MKTRSVVSAVVAMAALLALAGSAGADAIGNPSSANGWSTVSAVSVTASSAHYAGLRNPVNTINGSGLDNGTGLLHDNVWSNMWSSGTLADSAANVNPGTVAGSHWIKYTFDQVHTVTQMWIWNGNEENYPWFGMRTVTIQYSTTGGSNPSEWTTVYAGDIPMSVTGGGPNEPVSLKVNFGGVQARYVVITASSDVRNWSIGRPSEYEDVQLSEVRFYTPTPVPPGGAIGNPGPANGWDTSGAVTATASSSWGVRTPIMAINGSGLDNATGLLHDFNYVNEWLSGPLPDSTPNPGTVSGSHWIEFTFDQVYPIHEMWIWNCNENNYPWFGVKDVTIQCSTNGVDWTTAYTGQIPMSQNTYALLPPSARIPFGGLQAKYVVLTAASGDGINWSIGRPTEYDMVELSEVRFYTPVADPPPGGAIGNPSAANGWDSSGGVRVTADSTHWADTAQPINVINGAGITADGLKHDNNYLHMWLSGDLAAGAANPNPGTQAGAHWIRFDFDKAFNLGEVWLWNFNEQNWPHHGISECFIQYSETGGSLPMEWGTVVDTGIPIATQGGMGDSPVDFVLNFDGRLVKSIVITSKAPPALHNWSGSWNLEEDGLSAARFFTALPVKTVQGTVNLRDLAADKVAGTQVTIEIRNPGEDVSRKNYTVTLGAGGTYSFETTFAGLRDVAVKQSHWLRHTRTNVDLTGTAHITINFDLTNGDCDNDNAITSTDLAMVLAAMDTLPADPNADLNGDGAVDSADLLILLNSMDVTGNP